MKHTGSCEARAAAVVAGLAAAALITLATTASAQNYPNKPVRLLAGFVPGGSTDLPGALSHRNSASCSGSRGSCVTPPL